MCASLSDLLYGLWFYNKCWGQAHHLTPKFIIEPDFTRGKDHQRENTPFSLNSPKIIQRYLISLKIKQILRKLAKTA